MINDREFKDALRGINSSDENTSSNTTSTFSPKKTTEEVFIKDLIGTADEDGYIWLNILNCDPNDSLRDRRAIARLEKYLDENGINANTCLQPSKHVKKELFLSETAKNKMEIEFKYDSSLDCYRVRAVAYQDNNFIVLGDKSEDKSWFSNLDYELPFFAEKPIYGLIKIKESELVNAILYALADSRIVKADYLWYGITVWDAITSRIFF